MRIAASVTRLTGSNAYVSTHSTNFYYITRRTCIYALPLLFAC